MITALLTACNADKPPETSTPVETSSRPKKKKTAAPKPVPDAKHCPKAMPQPFTQCDKGAAPCSYPAKCQSGTVNVKFTCNEHGSWSVKGEACSAQYDSCPGTSLYCQRDGTWWMPTATNPPSPCPATRPKEGDGCHPGGMGGVWENCGYPCKAADTPWVVATCARDGGDSPAQGQWKYDKACP